MREPTFAELVQEVAALRELVHARVRLHRKEVLVLYGISKSALYRRMDAGDFPRPSSKIAGPTWAWGDLEAAEQAGRLPCPKPDAVRTDRVSGVRS